MASTPQPLQQRPPLPDLGAMAVLPYSLPLYTPLTAQSYNHLYRGSLYAFWLLPTTRPEANVG